MSFDNKMSLKFLAKSENESFARNVVSCFCLQLNPSVAELTDIKTAVSEAVTNSIVHAYNDCVGEVMIEAFINGDEIHINVFDEGVGIENVNLAIEPFFSTKLEDERSGMGFTIMQSFMDDVKVVSEIGKGTKVYMLKKIKTDD